MQIPTRTRLLASCLSESDADDQAAYRNQAPGSGPMDHEEFRQLDRRLQRGGPDNHQRRVDLHRKQFGKEINRVGQADSVAHRLRRRRRTVGDRSIEYYDARRSGRDAGGRNLDSRRFYKLGSKIQQKQRKVGRDLASKLGPGMHVGDLINRKDGESQMGFLQRVGFLTSHGGIVDSHLPGHDAYGFSSNYGDHHQDAHDFAGMVSRKYGVKPVVRRGHPTMHPRPADQHDSPDHWTTVHVPREKEEEGH